MYKYLLTAFLILALLPVSVRAATVNINTATAAELDTLPGIGPSKAAAIIDYRTTHGPFGRIEDIQEVKGIGPSTYEGFKALIRIHDSTEPAKPVAPLPSSSKKQTVTKTTVPAKSTNVSTTAHDTTPVSAPGATAEAAALGATASAVAALPTPASPARVLQSPWTLGFLGVVVLAAAAFMIL